MRVHWLDDARGDLRHIGRYIAMDRPTVAKDVMARIRRAASGLGRNPGLGRSGAVLGTRELVVPGLPYVIVYRVRDPMVEILWVIDGRQDWPRSFDVGSRV